MSAEKIYPEYIGTKKKDLSIEEWMRRDWDARAQKDIKYFIRSVYKQTEEEFWKSGEENCNQILGKDEARYNLIIGDKNPKEMKVLEIGCGIGRILIPMSKIFGEAIGVDISDKMVEVGKSYVEKISNCKIMKTDGSDLKEFSNDYFDFCYSYIVFQHIPDKEIVINYIREVSRVLKPRCIFRFQVFGNTTWRPRKINTWTGVHFSSKDIHEIAKASK